MLGPAVGSQMVSHAAGWGARARGVNDQEEEGRLQPLQSHMDMEGRDDGRSRIMKEAKRRGDMMNSSRLQKWKKADFSQLSAYG